MKYIFLLFLVIGCSTHKEAKTTSKVCLGNDDSIEKRHAVISAKRQGRALANCFKNYIRFQENKKQSINICHQISIKVSGKVNSTRVFGIDTKIPNDLKMCLEQSLWVMNFKSLTNIKFCLFFSILALILKI